MTLKELRVWHWQKLLQARIQQRKHEEIAAAFVAGPHKIGISNTLRAARSLDTAKRYGHKASLHLGAVQALNDVVPGTAEQDLFLTQQEA